jgi:hypothetical protein
MKANEKIHVKYYCAYTTETKYGDGEIGVTNSAWDIYSNPVDGGFGTVTEALKTICEKNSLEYDPENIVHWAKAIGRFTIMTLVDENNFEASQSEIELWKTGNKRLWNCYLEVYLCVRTERELTAEEAEGWK